MAFPSNSTSHGSSIFLTSEEVEFLVGVKLGTVAWNACICAQIGLLCWEYVNTLSLDLALLTGKSPIRPCGACFLAARLSLLGCYISHVPMLQTSRSLDCQILWIVILVFGATAINASSAILCFRACAIWSYRPITTIPILLLWLVQLALWFLDIISLRLTQVNLLIFGRTCFVTGMANMTAVPLCWTLVVDLSVSALIVGKLQSRQYKGTNLYRRHGSAKTTIGEIIASQMWLFTMIAIPSVATAAAVFWISKSSLIRLIPLGPTILCHVLLASRAFIQLHRVAEQLPDAICDKSQIQNGEKLDIATMRLKITNVSIWTLPGGSSSHPEGDSAPSSPASSDDVEIRGGQSSTGILRAPQRFNYSQRRGGTSSQNAARAALAGARSALMARQPTVVIKTEPSILIPPRLEIGSSPTRSSDMSTGVVVARRSIEPSSNSSSTSRTIRHLRATSTQQLPPSLKESPTLGTSESQAADLADGYVSDLDSFGDSESDASVEEVIDSDCACDACRGKVQIAQSGGDPSAGVDFGVLPEAAASEASSTSSLILNTAIAQAQTHIPSIPGDTSVCACCLVHRPAQLHQVAPAAPPFIASLKTCRQHRAWAPNTTLAAPSTPSLSPSMTLLPSPDQQLSSTADLQSSRALYAATVSMARDHPYANASAFTDKHSTGSLVNPSPTASRVQVQVSGNANGARLAQTPSASSTTSRRSCAKRAGMSPSLSDETFGNPWVSSAPFVQSVHPLVPLHPPVTARSAASPAVEDLVRQAAYLAAPSHETHAVTSPSTTSASNSLSSSSRRARLTAVHPAEADIPTHRGDADVVSASGSERARMHRSRAMSVDRLRIARKDGADV